MTGAGASAESGIAPFRAPGATRWLWSGLGGVGVVIAGTGYAWRWWPWLANVFFRRCFLASIEAARPNASHRVFAKVGACVLTTNVDELHERAGSPPERVAALHGTARHTMCSVCGKADQACCGAARPAVLFFMDLARNELVGEAWERTASLVEFEFDADRPPWVLVVGVSWAIPTFQGALGRLRDRGARVVHVNLVPPPERYSREDDVWVNASADEFFSVLEKILGENERSHVD